jgi:small-conductance mechanosensitive channel/CRP-like cAMP-binding protein
MYSLWTAAGLFVISILIWKPLERDRARVRTAFGLLVLWACAAGFALVASQWEAEVHVAREVEHTLLILAAIQVGTLLLFDLLLHKVRLPKFAGEITIVGGYAIALFQLLNRLGVNATGLFATSAVATAVVGLALQDMLSNLAGGITLQLEDSINNGDYIRCSEYSGWAQHVRFRHTSILTSDGDTVILPNSFLTRSPVVIVSHKHRRLLHFSMPYTQDPQEIIHAVRTALRASPITDIATEPQPDCILQEFMPGHVQYAAVVWLTKPGNEFIGISAVMNRVYYALERAGIPTGEIAHLIETRAAVTRHQEATPEEVLQRTPIFRLLEDEDLKELATHLRRMTFAPGEHIVHQGDSGDSMYFLVAGHVEVSIRAADGVEKNVATFEPGDFFGEVSLLTGESRSVTITATSRVTCYHLNKAGLQHTMDRQPDLAEDMSVIMAHRQIELTAARESMDRETAVRRESENQMQILARIRRFFGISSSSASA